MKKAKYFLFIFLFSVIVIIAVAKDASAETYDVATDTNWNIRIDGEQAGDKIGRYNISYGDIDDDGNQDLILAVNSPLGYSGRTSLNIIYLISNSILSNLSSYGNIIDLSDPDNYSLKIVSASTGDYSDYYVASATDLNNNNKDDLVIGEGYASDTASYQGIVYVIYDSILDTYTGQTGQVLDLADSNNYNVKFLGAADSDYLGYSYKANLDLDDDGKNDLILNADAADSTNGADAGSLYVIYNDLLATFTGVGTVIDMGNSNNYNIRVDGPDAGLWTESYVVSQNSDVNSDGVNDLIVYAPWADNNSAPYSGSMYAVYSTILDTYTGVGNVLDLADPTKFNLRIDGVKDNSLSSGPTFGYSVTQVADIDDNGDNDLFLADGYADENGRSNSGSAFVIFDSIIQSHLGVGQVLDLTSSTDYSLRYDGAEAASYLGEDIHVMDVDNDGKLDVLIDAAGSSAAYILKNSTVTNDLVTTGQIFDFADSASYDDLYTSSTGYLSSPYAPADLDGDDSVDFIFSDPYTDYNSRNDSGSVYIIYNFPHEISLSSADTSDGFVLTGVVSSVSSVANISSVEYQLDTNDIFGTWTACTADDEAFDSLSESFTCSISSEALDDGSHTLYVRSMDAKSALTVLGNYLSNTFIITPTPVHHITSSGSAPHYTLPVQHKEIQEVTDDQCLSGHLFNSSTGLPCNTTVVTNTTASSTTTKNTATVPARDLKLNILGEDVKQLQKLLNANGYVVSPTGPGSIGQETNKFGTLTQKALIKYQKAKGITPTMGYFGPKTRAMMKSEGLGWW